MISIIVDDGQNSQRIHSPMDVERLASARWASEMSVGLLARGNTLFYISIYSHGLPLVTIYQETPCKRRLNESPTSRSANVALTTLAETE